MCPAKHFDRVLAGKRGVGCPHLMLASMLGNLAGAEGCISVELDSVAIMCVVPYYHPD